MSCRVALHCNICPVLSSHLIYSPSTPPLLPLPLTPILTLTLTLDRTCPRYEARETLRWYSSWVLIIACIPVLAMYSLWMYHTIAGHIEPISDEGHATRRDEQQDTARTDGDSLNDDGIYNLQPVRCELCSILHQRLIHCGDRPARQSESG